MVPAWDERKEIRFGSIDKRSDPIGNLLLKYEFTPTTELLDALGRACAQEQFDLTVWATIKLRIEEVQSTLSPVDSAIVLKSIMLYLRKTPDQINEFSQIAVTLIHRLSNPRLSAKSVGNYSILYTLQGLNMFSKFIDSPDMVIKHRTSLLKRMVVGERLPNLSTTALVNLLQAVASIPELPYTDKIVEECHGRLETDESLDVDMVFGMLAAVAKSTTTSVSTETRRNFFIFAKKLILSHSTGYMHLLTPEQLIGTVHAFSRSGPATVSGHVDLFSAIADRIVSLERENTEILWTPRMLSVLLNSYGTAAVLHNDLIAAISRSALPTVIPEMDDMQTAMCMHAISRLGILKHKIFSPLLVHAESHVPRMSIHSTAKLVISLVDSTSSMRSTWKLLNACLEHMTRRISSKSTLGKDDYDSVVLTVAAISKTGPLLLTSGQTGITDYLEKLIMCISSSIQGDLGVLSKISTELAAVPGHAISEDAMSKFNTAILNSVLLDPTLVGLGELAKILHACGSLEIQGHQDVILGMVCDRAGEIRNLTFRPLTRLGMAMNSLGLIDDDISEAINERLLELTRNKTKRSTKAS